MKNRSLTFKFTLMFAAFTFVTLAVSAFLSYVNQNQIYKGQREDSIQQVADYLEKRIAADGDTFQNMLGYLVAHYKELKIPENFTEKDVEAGKQKFARLFADRHPGKILGEDIHFEELDDELKTLHTTAYLEFYTIMLENAVKSFNIAYAYFVVPTPEPLHMYYAIISLRESKEIDGKPYLLLCDDVLEPLEEHAHM